MLKIVENFSINLHKNNWLISKKDIEWDKKWNEKNMKIVGNEIIFTKEEEERIDRLLVESDEEQERHRFE